MINEDGKIAPAPWVPFTRAGCDFGAVATANTILENTAIDIPTVFGTGSPEATEVAGDGGAAGTQSFADFVGIGVHCAKNSTLCASSAHARPDTLTDEPGGYNGFSGLFGAAYVNPIIKPSGPMADLDGNVIQDANGHAGFPGFDGMEVVTPSNCKPTIRPSRSSSTGSLRMESRRRTPCSSLPWTKATILWAMPRLPMVATA